MPISLSTSLTKNKSKAFKYETECLRQRFPNFWLWNTFLLDQFLRKYFLSLIYQIKVTETRY